MSPEEAAFITWRDDAYALDALAGHSQTGKLRIVVTPRIGAVGRSEGNGLNVGTWF